MTELGYPSVHVKDIGMSSSTDKEIFTYAFENGFIIISADTDFGFILSSWLHNKPSVILLRMIPAVPEIQIKYITKVVQEYESEIKEGDLLIITPDKIRIRKLPLF